MIGIKDTTKEDNYIVTVGAVSFQLTMEEAKTLALRIENMFADKDNRVELVKQTIDKNMSTAERIELIFQTKDNGNTKNIYGVSNGNCSKEYPLGKPA
jgi:coenzyme F420-reducing hydrogenase alpha subunit